MRKRTLREKFWRSRTLKRCLGILIGCFVLGGTIAGCSDTRIEGGEYEYDDEVIAEKNQIGHKMHFVVVDRFRIDVSGNHDNVRVAILVDCETRVMYAQEIFMSGYRGGTTITPLYNADGTLRVYDGELP